MCMISICNVYIYIYILEVFEHHAPALPGKQTQTSNVHLTVYYNNNTETTINKQQTNSDRREAIEPHDPALPVTKDKTLSLTPLMYIYIYIYMYVCMYVCMYIYIYIYIYIYVAIYIYTHTHTYTHTYVYTHM